MNIKRLCLFWLALTVLASSAYAQYEALAGIPAEGADYANYKFCIDSCAQCEANCKVNTYRIAADTQNNEEFCNYLPEEEKKSCRERVYMANAISSKDSAECQKITDEAQKEGCLLNVQTENAITNENEADCNPLGDLAESCKQAFYSRMAVLKSDSSYCDKITDATSKEICKSSTATEEQPSEENAGESPLKKLPIKSLITYGIIILAVIIFAVLAVIIVKKISGKKQNPPLMVQQTKQQGSPLVLQKGAGQQMQRAGAGTGVPDQLSGKQKVGESK